MAKKKGSSEVTPRTSILRGTPIQPDGMPSGKHLDVRKVKDAASCRCGRCSTIGRGERG